MQNASLVLEDGTIFRGTFSGFKSEIVAELVFNTAHTGYEEIISDPSYNGQIVTFTSPHIGNTGITKCDLESKKIHISAMICKSLSDYDDHSMSKGNLSDFFKREKRMIFHGIDTRELTKKIRKKGSMLGIISALENRSDILKKRLYAEKEKRFTNPVNDLNIRKQRLNHGAQFKLAVYDFGIKKGMIDQLTALNCELKLFPYTSSPQEILATKPDALFLSNGPGNPKELTSLPEKIRSLIPKLPTFGICLGHQLLCLAFGGDTYKLQYGHHAANHPVKRLDTNQVEITSQNHNYAVSLDAIKDDVIVTHRHMNDGSISGFRHRYFNCFSVQFHPEANPGPHDSHYLFRDFIELISRKKAA